MLKNKFVLLLLLIAIPACTSSTTQAFTPTLPAPLATSSPFITSMPSPIPTSTLSPIPESSERPCTSDDFQTSSTLPDPDKPETLIGFRPHRDWLPSNQWETTIGSYDIQFDYSIQGYKNANQHLFVLEKPICRYEENKYALAEIKDFILIPDLAVNEIIIWSPTLEYCCFLQPNILERLKFTWEWFAPINCIEIHSHAIALARYNLDKLPNKIEPGSHLPIEVVTGWLPDVNTNTFEEFPTAGMSCIISFQGA